MYFNSLYQTGQQTNGIIEAYLDTVNDGQEPVTVDEAKRHMNMLFDTSGSYTFTDDDTYIGTLIQAARDMLERYTGVSFVLRDITVVVRNQLNYVELPYGPVPSNFAPTVYDIDDTLVTDDVRFQGGRFKTINYISDYLRLGYSTGYAAGDLPPALKRAILEQVAWMYKNRGDQDSGDVLCESAKATASYYNRNSLLV